ncbi:MAG TPA: dihydrolipoamide acetyltransferase family protein [Steroidobacteraceae bacterium]|nr:dihydrolipoamide acetyltransferase family protein [Steroidobacteraceae bacterium]
MYEFKMPSLGADMEDGSFIEWHAEPGQSVARGQAICVVETQKGAVEVEIWEAGVLAKLIASPGQKIPVGQVMALVATAGEDWKAIAAAVPPPPAVTGSGAPPPPSGRVKVSPAARRRAEELGVDLAAVQPSGAHGAISIADVELAAAAKKPPDRQAGMRDAIAAAMSRSKREIPHYYLASEINVERAMAWLEKHNAAVPIGERVLFAALQLKAVACALRETPELNGFYQGGAFRPGTGMHLGVAVSLRGGGLVAPALHDVDKQSLADLMTGLKDLLRRARSGQVRSSEMADPTITVTNLGDLGVDTVFGVIYPPQVALVGIGRSTVKPWVTDGAIVPARIVQATLSADHRVSDGMRGARFLVELDRLFQQPESLA